MHGRKKPRDSKPGQGEARQNHLKAKSWMAHEFGDIWRQPIDWHRRDGKNAENEKDGIDGHLCVLNRCLIVTGCVHSNQQGLWVFPSSAVQSIRDERHPTPSPHDFALNDFAENPLFGIPVDCPRDRHARSMRPGFIASRSGRTMKR